MFNRLADLPRTGGQVAAGSMPAVACIRDLARSA